MGVKHYSVKVTKQAENQMREIAVYIASDLQNAAAALAMLDAFEQVLDSLHVFPQRIALTGEEPWRSRGIHKAVIKNYLMYFWIDEEESIVQVTAVAYGGRSQRNALENMESE